mmetsp:Transcript_28407/g.44327  ORF Transcript_28407/g.44327 Transcript_28407/m.44327 type:complete len:89 (+) Transcript_28407:1448-1714(+)
MATTKTISSTAAVAEKEYNLLRGHYLVRPEAQTIRVKGSRNVEPWLWITDSKGTKLIEQPETAASSKKRAAAQHDTEPRQKKPRTSCK